MALALALERMVCRRNASRRAAFGFASRPSASELSMTILLLDLAYEEDSRAQVDMNVVMTGGGRFVEVQASAEGRPYTSNELQQLLALAAVGIANSKVQQELCT